MLQGALRATVWGTDLGMLGLTKGIVIHLFSLAWLPVNQFSLGIDLGQVIDSFLLLLFVFYVYF